MNYHLAQVNVARLLAPLNSEQLRDFVVALNPVNASGDVAPGFLWRLQTDDGNATGVRAFEWDIEGSAGFLVNLSVWESLADLSTWVAGPLHRAVLLQRRRWFERVAEATTALWWIHSGERPSVVDAEERRRFLRSHGATPYAFTFEDHVLAPDDGSPLR